MTARDSELQHALNRAHRAEREAETFRALIRGMKAGHVSHKLAEEVPELAELTKWVAQLLYAAAGAPRSTVYGEGGSARVVDFPMPGEENRWLRGKLRSVRADLARTSKRIKEALDPDNPDHKEPDRGRCPNGECSRFGRRGTHGARFCQGCGVGLEAK